MKIQVLHIWCKCAIVVLKRGYIYKMSLSIAFGKEKKKRLLHSVGKLDHGTPLVT